MCRMRFNHAACVLAAIVPISAIPAQDPPDVEKLITDARAAHQAVRSAHYRGQFELVIEGREETYTRNGEVWFVKHPPPTPPQLPQPQQPPPPLPPPPDDDDAVPATPPTGPESELGANVRIELEDGSITTFDGETTYMLMPQVQKLLTAAIADGGERFITGNITGNLVETPLLQSGRLPALPQGEWNYAGEETIEGVPCHVIEFRPPDNEQLSDQLDTIWLGQDDLLMRQRDMRYVVDGNRRQERWVITDVEIDVEIEPSQFKLNVPEGFTVEAYKPEPPPVGDDDGEQRHLRAATLP